MPRKKKKQLTINSPEVKATFGVAVLILGIAIALSPFLTEAVALNSFNTLLGYSSIMWGFTVVTFALRSITSWEYFNKSRTLIGMVVGSFTASTFFAFWTPSELTDTKLMQDYGGSLGYAIHSAIVGSTGKLIEFLLILFLIVISFSLLSGVGVDAIVARFSTIAEKLFSNFSGFRKKDQDSDKLDIVGIPKDDEEDDIIIETSKDDIDQISMDTAVDARNIDMSSVESKSDEVDFKVETQKDDSSAITTTPQYENWKFPPLELLQEPVNKMPDEEVHKRNAVLIERTLRSFGVESKVNKVTIGPTVVQYALSITVGIKVATIKKLSNDIALALATPENQVRIEAPIPGTSLIGIEMPNPTPNFVYIRDLVREIQRDSNNFELPLALGKNVKGESILKDLTKMPHLLVAGATGTGKSVGINSILTGLLMSKTPDELKLILVDPKMVELAPYNGIPHLLTKVITDMELVVNALQWAVEEMNTRYRILKQIGARNVLEYNGKTAGQEVMPYIVIVIDEMADLILSTGADVETNIVKLAQKARAVGIHLILATQRPSREVITGLIKANVPGRIAFSVATQIDSRVILDVNGAESLIGRGDLLFKSPETKGALRLQGAWTDTVDTEKLIKFINDQVDGVDYNDNITQPTQNITAGASGGTGVGQYSDDDLFTQAVDIIINAQKGSSSLLQRRLKIGYNRAARLVDELEEAGVVGPPEGSSARKVMYSSVEEFYNKFETPPSQE